MAVELQHISYSSANLYLLCAKAWAFRYRDGIKAPPSAAATFGSAVHRVIEEFLRSKVDGATRISTGSLPTRWLHIWQEWPKSDVIGGEEQTDSDLMQVGTKLFELRNLQLLLEKLNPLMRDSTPIVEHRIELRVPGIPVPIIGYADLVTDDLIPCDFKTSGRPWTAERAANEFQPLVYLAAFNQMGWKVPELKFRHHILVKSSKPLLQTFETCYRPSQIFGLVEMLQHVWRGIQAGAFPGNTTGWKHSPKYCEYWESCPLGGK